MKEDRGGHLDSVQNGGAPRAEKLGLGLRLAEVLDVFEG